MNTKSLHTRLKMALLLHSRESGFAMVIAVSLGLIMILVGLTMTMRSQGDQITASQQKATDQALAAAEKGVAFYQQFLNNNRMLAVYPNCNIDPDTGECSSNTAMSWADPQLPGFKSACNPGTPPDTIATAASTSWQPVDSTDVTKGQFRLVSYSYDPDNRPNPPSYPGNGTLIVEGRMANSTSNDEETKAITRLQVVIPVKEPDIENVPIPGVWLGGSNDDDSDATGRNPIAANLLVNNCSLELTDINIVGSNFSAQKTDLSMPTLPEMPTTGVINLGTISTNTTIPVTTGPNASRHTPINFMGQSTYVYSVDGMTGSGNTTLSVTAPNNVVIFLNGNIDKNIIVDYCRDVTGNRVSNCDPMNFKIFGRGPVGSFICLNGNRYLEAFILAPNYTVGVAGGGSGGGVKGAVWTRSWSNPNSSTVEGDCASNTANVVVEQQGSWSSLGLQPKYLKPTIDRITSWQRQNVN
jgi:Tfp pilus assembly protein PilX